MLLNRLARTAACTLLFSLLRLSPGYTQAVAKPYTKQFSITTENDRYVFKGADGYYTNGLVLGYNRLSKPRGDGQKRINRFELGQQIYMPYDRKIYNPSQIDRPVSGYLFARFTRSMFKAPNRLWQWGVSADAIGDASLARGLQNTFHDLIGIDSRRWGWVWDYQVKSQLGFNVHGTHAAGLLNERTARTLQITPVTKATVGTSFVNISQSVVVQLGQLRSPDQSAFWEAALGGSADASKQMEWSLFYQPSLLYQVYNATTQGGLFRKDKGPITSAPEPVVFTHQAGALFSYDRYLLRFSASFQTKEARSQLYSQSFGSVQASYSIR